MASIFFRMEAHSIISSGWGDYGDILEHGMTAHLPREDGMLSLERTGPYIAPITFPGLGDVVLTAPARANLEASGLSGFSFRPVVKKLIVDLHWEAWDLSADEPAEYPEGGEPENYILGRPHSPIATAAIGDLWELVVDKTATVIKPERKPRQPWSDFFKECRIDVSTWNGADIFRSQNFGSIFLSERGRDWFLNNFGLYVRVDEFQSA